MAKFQNPLTGEVYKLDGPQLYNPYENESCWIIKQNNPKIFQFLWVAEPGSKMPFSHLHSVQTETIKILEGQCRLLLPKGRSLLLEKNRSFRIDMGIVHQPINHSKTNRMVMHVTVEPALHFEKILKNIYRLIAEGKCSGSGKPKLLYMIAMHYRYPEGYMPYLPRWLQDGAAKLLGPLLIRLGYGPKE